NPPKAKADSYPPSRTLDKPVLPLLCFCRMPPATNPIAASPDTSSDPPLLDNCSKATLWPNEPSQRGQGSIQCIEPAQANSCSYRQVSPYTAPETHDRHGHDAD